MGAASSKWKHLTPAQQEAFTAFGPDTVERMQEQFCNEAGPVDTHVQDVFTVMVRNSSSVITSSFAQASPQGHCLPHWHRRVQTCTQRNQTNIVLVPFVLHERAVLALCCWLPNAHALQPEIL